MSVAIKLQPPPADAAVLEEGPCCCPLLLLAAAAGWGEAAACWVCCRASATEQMTYPLPHPTSRHLQQRCVCGSQGEEEEIA
jgi:hypothetical protein